MKYLYAAAATAYLFTLGVFRGRNRPLISRICSHFGFPRRYLIPEIPISGILPEAGSISINEPVGVNGNISLLETVVLAGLLKKHKPDSIFEFGTFDGRSTLNMAANAGPAARVYTLDLPDGAGAATALTPALAENALKTARVTGARFRGTEFERKITQLRGDSASFDFSPYSGRMDFVFVDGSHAYEYVLNDSKKALALIGDRRGIVVWHDYGTEGWEGVIRALEKLYAEGGVFGGLRRICGTTMVVLVKDTGV